MAGSKEAQLIRTAGFEIGEPIVIDHLAVVPIKRVGARTQEPTVDYLTLAEAMKLGVVVVTERTPAVVAQLLVANLGDRPILLVAGDLLVGGQQDRVVSKDTVVQPGGKVAVSVFCVEEGRWHGEKEFAASDAKAPRSVREAAMLDTDQGVVWERARKSNSFFKVAEDTTTVAASISASRQRVESLLPALEHALDGPDVVGVVYAVNGRVRSLDLFRYPRLFSASRRSLLMAFLSDGVTESKERLRAPQRKDIEQFVALMVERRNQKPAVGGDGVARIQGRGYKGMEFHDSETPNQPPVHHYMSMD